MSARSWIAIVAGALLVLAAWFSLGIEGEPPASPVAPSPDHSVAALRSVLGREVEESESAAAPRQVALLREPELELRGQVLTTDGAPIGGAKLAVVLPVLREVPEISEDRQGVERTLATGRSEADGSFILRVDPDVAHDLLAEAQGFARIRMANLYAGEEVHVVLPRSAAIFGRVTDAVDGMPLAGVEIDAGSEAARASYAAGYRSTTDRYGTYRIEALPSGAFSPNADGRDHVKTSNRRVTLEEGQELRVDFSLPRGTI
ncbi:MAG TPA: carboxypeptidase-like regulatory domain-containing protein, partial [Planctomycetota bacterium]|nr:carboxypeptidase-like regulatory domain-containing protein [Planctomycetota bacterium]